jgi:hypothetical protein
MSAQTVEAPSFDQLVREAQALIPVYAESWTNHNASDPGITLVELLAYYCEILCYRAARVTPDAKLHFLRLLEGAAAPVAEHRIGQPTKRIDDAIRQRIAGFAGTETAVTAADFELLAVRAANDYLKTSDRVHARCLPATELAEPADAPISPSAADVAVILAVETAPVPERMTALCAAVTEKLEAACLLTTHARVIGVEFLDVEVGARIMPRPGVAMDAAIARAQAAIAERFDPWRSGAGQPFGRTLYLAAIAAAIDRTEGIDYVEAVSVERMRLVRAPDGSDAVGVRIGRHARLGTDAWLGGQASRSFHRLETDEGGEAISVHAAPWEIIRVRLALDLVTRAVDHG